MAEQEQDGAVAISGAVADALVSQAVVDALEAVLHELRTNRKSYELVDLALQRFQQRREGVFTRLLAALVRE